MASLTCAHVLPDQADEKLLQPKGGFFGGMGERGVGGSKCGSTGAVALVFKDGRGKRQLLAANVGDARVLLARRGKAVQLTIDHVPDRRAACVHGPSPPCSTLCRPSCILPPPVVGIRALGCAGRLRVCVAMRALTS